MDYTKPALLVHDLLNSDAPSKLLALARFKDLAFQDSYMQQQLIREGCIPELLSSMESAVEEESALSTTIIMRLSLLGM